MTPWSYLQDIYIFVFTLQEEFSFRLLTEKTSNKHVIQIEVIKVDIYPTSTSAGKSRIAPYIKCKMTLISIWLKLQRKKRKAQTQIEMKNKYSYTTTFLHVKKKNFVKRVIYHPPILWMEGNGIIRNDLIVLHVFSRSPQCIYMDCILVELIISSFLN